MKPSMIKRVLGMSFGWGIEEGNRGRGRDNGIEFDEDLSERELRAVMYRVVESRIRVPASEDMAAGRKRLLQW